MNENKKNKISKLWWKSKVGTFISGIYENQNEIKQHQLLLQGIKYFGKNFFFKIIIIY